MLALIPSELQSHLAEHGIASGRDRFFDLLAQHDLLVPPTRFTVIRELSVNLFQDLTLFAIHYSLIH